MGKNKRNRKFKKESFNLWKELLLPIIIAIVVALFNYWIDSEKEPKQTNNYQIIIINNQVDPINI